MRTWCEKLLAEGNPRYRRLPPVQLHCVAGYLITKQTGSRPHLHEITIGTSLFADVCKNSPRYTCLLLLCGENFGLNKFIPGPKAVLDRRRNCIVNIIKLMQRGVKLFNQRYVRYTSDNFILTTILQNKLTRFVC